jgi:putative Holliday junction resolvase
MRYLAIDYGTKRTGLAVCDLDETIASPLAIIEGQKELIKKIADIVEAENIGAIVLGLPLNMDDSEGAQARLVLRFAEQLKGYLDIPVHFQDERLSSFGAEEKMAFAEFTGSSRRRTDRRQESKKRKKHLDAVAAAEILQAFLERKNTS